MAAINKNPLSHTPDIVFSTRKKAIVVNGCFWHQLQDICRLAKHPKVTLEYWKPKLEHVRARDRRAINDLEKIGWDILVVWECQTKDLKHVGAKPLGISQRLNGSGLPTLRRHKLRLKINPRERAS
jgi:DNA mismatch endonuclease, patch repair protein